MDTGICKNMFVGQGSHVNQLATRSFRFTLKGYANPHGMVCGGGITEIA